MPLNIVITGSEGFLGRYTVARLAAGGNRIIAVDRVYHASEPRPGVLMHHADLAEPQHLMPESHGFDEGFTLVHLAWDMRRYEGYAIQAEQVRQFADLLDYWGKRGLSRVVMMGSAEEYGLRAGRLRESDEPGFPLSAYGWAKYASRQLARSWSVKSGIPVAWLRPFIMYGPGQRGDMLIPSAIEAARQRQRTDFTDGQQRRDFVFVDDVVNAMECCLQLLLPGFQEFNLGCGEEVLVADVLHSIARHCGAQALFNLGGRPRRPGEPEVQVADVSRARQILGWQAKVSIEEGIRMLCQAPQKP